MRETRPSGSEGGAAETNRPSLPLSRAYFMQFNTLRGRFPRNSREFRLPRWQKTARFRCCQRDCTLFTVVLRWGKIVVRKVDILSQVHSFPAILVFALRTTGTSFGSYLTTGSAMVLNGV